MPCPPGFFVEVEKESCTIDLWDSSGLLPDIPVPEVCLGLPPSKISPGDEGMMKNIHGKCGKSVV